MINGDKVIIERFRLRIILLLIIRYLLFFSMVAGFFLGQTRMLPEPFFVLASQNPIELEGTYPLPEAQLDRFLFKLNVAAADVDVMDSIISTRRRGEPPKPEQSQYWV